MFSFLNVCCRSDPGSEFTQEARDCNTAVSSLLSPDLSHDLVLTSGYYGAPIAAKMLAQAPGRYSAVILKNPELDLTRALVEEPNIIRRTFLTQSDRFTMLIVFKLSTIILGLLRRRSARFGRPHPSAEIRIWEEPKYFFCPVDQRQLSWEYFEHLSS